MNIPEYPTFIQGYRDNLSKVIKQMEGFFMLILKIYNFLGYSHKNIIFYLLNLRKCPL